jgi:hypothetical protein
MKTKHGILKAKMRSVLAGFAVLLMAAIFTLTGCPTDAADDDDPPPAFTGVQVYTLSGTTFTVYTGTGSEQAVTGVVTAGGESAENSIGTIGEISPAGKLTLELPTTVENSKLSSANDTTGTKFGILLITPNLQLYRSDGTGNPLMIEYVNNRVTSDGKTLKKGWNYLDIDFGTNDMTVITDISSYKWVIK